MDRDTYISQVRTLMDSRKISDALALSDRYTKMHPEDAEGWRYRAHVFEITRDFSQAITAMSEAIRLSPREPGYRWLRGMFYFRAGFNNEAEQDMTKTIQLGAQAESTYYDEVAHLLRAETYRRMGQADRARADCEHVGDGALIWVDQRISKQEILGSLPR